MGWGKSCMFRSLEIPGIRAVKNGIYLISQFLRGFAFLLLFVCSLSVFNNAIISFH